MEKKELTNHNFFPKLGGMGLIRKTKEKKKQQKQKQKKKIEIPKKGTHT